MSLVQVKWRPSMLVNTSPPRSIRRVMRRSWELEKDSISTATMLETVVADTDVKTRSRAEGLGDCQHQETQDGDGKEVQEVDPERVHMEEHKVVKLARTTTARDVQRTHLICWRYISVLSFYGPLRFDLFVLLCMKRSTRIVLFIHDERE